MPHSLVAHKGPADMVLVTRHIGTYWIVNINFVLLFPSRGGCAPPHPPFPRTRLHLDGRAAGRTGGRADGADGADRAGEADGPDG